MEFATNTAEEKEDWSIIEYQNTCTTTSKNVIESAFLTTTSDTVIESNTVIESTTEEEEEVCTTIDKKFNADDEFNITTDDKFNNTIDNKFNTTMINDASDTVIKSKIESHTTEEEEEELCTITTIDSTEDEFYSPVVANKTRTREEDNKSIQLSTATTSTITTKHIH